MYQNFNDYGDGYNDSEREAFDDEYDKNVDYEKLSYDRRTYRQVQKLRVKGRRRGIDVPRLNFQLTKPNSPRVAFWVVAVLSAVLFIGLIVALFFLYNSLVKEFTDFNNAFDALAGVFDPTLFVASAGLSALPAIMIFLTYALVVVLLLIPIFAAVYFYRFVRETFYMAKCSKEEFAKGNIVSARIGNLCTTLIVSAVILVLLLIMLPASAAKVWLGVIFGVLAVALGGYLGVLLAERKKCRDWFYDCDEENVENYTAHAKALRLVKGRVASDKRLWDSLFRRK